MISTHKCQNSKNNFSMKINSNRFVDLIGNWHILSAFIRILDHENRTMQTENIANYVRGGDFTLLTKCKKNWVN